MHSDTPISLWDVSASETFDARPFHSGQTVDVAIIGGGFTGLSTALHCVERGLSVQVIEAHTIGHGGSGRNAGLVNAGVWHPPAKVRKALGDVYGPRFVARFGDAPRKVFDLIEKHQMRCEVTRTGTIHAAHAPAGFADLQTRYQAWKELGAPVHLLSSDEVAERTGSRIFHGGLLDERAGTINPMGYVRGLARAADAAGAQIACGVQARALQAKKDEWIVQTDKGELTAKNVVLATNAYSDDLWPGLKRSYTTIPYFQLATTPLGDRIRDILPQRQGLWDTGTIMFSVRRDMSNRLIIGSMGSVLGTASRGLSCRWAQRKLSKLFPDLGPVEFEQAWHGQIAMTPDHLPRVHQLASGLYTAIGYNGRGITTGTLFGEAIAELLTGADPTTLPLPMSQPQTLYSAPFMTRFYNAAFSMNQLIRSI